MPGPCASRLRQNLDRHFTQDASSLDALGPQIEDRSFVNAARKHRSAEKARLDVTVTPLPTFDCPHRAPWSDGSFIWDDTKMAPLNSIQVGGPESAETTRSSTFPYCDPLTALSVGGLLETRLEGVSARPAPTQMRACRKQRSRRNCTIETGTRGWKRLQGALNPMDSKAAGGPKVPLVNLSDPHAVRHWCKELACTPNELREAVIAAGHAVEDVRKFLRQRRPGSGA